MRMSHYFPWILFCFVLLIGGACERKAEQSLAVNASNSGEDEASRQAAGDSPQVSIENKVRTPELTPGTSENVEAQEFTQEPSLKQGRALQLASCSKGQCRVFPSAAAALAQAVRETQPRVIGFGEAHQRKNDVAPSTANRFLKELFIPLSQHSSALLLEILSPPDAGCQQEEQQVRQGTAPVIEKQSGTNQADYIALGRKARSLGVQTELLDIKCSDLTTLSTAGQETVALTMRLIAERSKEKLRSWLKQELPKVILSYGGALHNDLHPSKARADWSYGPSLSNGSTDSYLEIDLVRADALSDDSPWLRLEAAALLKQSVELFKGKGARGALLLKRSPRSYFIVLGALPSDDSKASTNARRPPP